MKNKVFRCCSTEYKEHITDWTQNKCACSPRDVCTSKCGCLFIRGEKGTGYFSQISLIAVFVICLFSDMVSLWSPEAQAGLEITAILATFPVLRLHTWDTTLDLCNCTVLLSSFMRLLVHGLWDEHTSCNVSKCDQLYKLNYFLNPNFIFNTLISKRRHLMFITRY